MVLSKEFLEEEIKKVEITLDKLREGLEVNEIVLEAFKAQVK